VRPVRQSLNVTGTTAGLLLSPPGRPLKVKPRLSYKAAERRSGDRRAGQAAVPWSRRRSSPATVADSVVRDVPTDLDRHASVGTSRASKCCVPSEAGIESSTIAGAGK
jgi:hypothetical protein